MLDKLFQALSKPGETLQQEYDRLSFEEARGKLTRGQAARLDVLRPQFGIHLIKDAQGKIVGSLGTREEQLDRAMGAIISKTMAGTAEKLFDMPSV